jgi:hypothetical protein
MTQLDVFLTSISILCQCSSYTRGTIQYAIPTVVEPPPSPFSTGAESRYCVRLRTAAKCGECRRAVDTELHGHGHFT